MNRHKNEQLRDALAESVRRARVLRQIQSNKAGWARNLEQAYLIVTVVIATMVSVFSFAGVSRIAGIIPAKGFAAKQVRDFVDLGFNIAVLLVLIATLVGLIFRFGERANRHYRSLEALTEFIRDCEDQILIHDAGIQLVSVVAIDLARTRYKGILTSLPPSNDKEYTKAKEDVAAKMSKSK